MRFEDIKFKAKRLKDGSWIEGYFGHYDRNDSNKAHIVERCDNGNFIIASVDPSTVCQYTGRKAENGTPIYEGDIVECTYFNEQGDDTHIRGTVTWEQDVWGFILKDFSFDKENPLYEGYEFIGLPNTDDTESTIKVLHSKFDKEGA